MGETKGEQLSTEESLRETAGCAAFYEVAEARPRWTDGGAGIDGGAASKVGGGVLRLGRLAVASSASSACDSAGTSYRY